MLRRLSILLVVLALLAAGCGGGDESSSDTTTLETTTEETTTEETTTDEGTTSEPDLSGILADEDCLALAGVGATIAQAYAGGAGSAEGTDELNALVDKVPDEIKADVQVIAQWYADYASKIEDIGIEPGSTPSAEQLQELQSALASFDQQELTDASTRLSAWAEANCSAGG